MDNTNNKKNMDMNLEIKDIEKICISINNILLYFIQTKFSNKNGFNEFYNNVKLKLEQLKYEISETMDAQAQYEHTTNTITISSRIVDGNLNSIIGTYCHELSHLISNSSGNTKRFEEGIADLFSDILIDFINQNKLLSDCPKLEYKLTSYTSAGSIVRSISMLCNNYLDLMWYYYNYSDDAKDYNLELYDYLSEYINRDTMIKLLKNNLTMTTLKKENVLINTLISNLEISEIPSILIHNNELFQKMVLEKLQQENIYNLEECKQKYPNLPESFYTQNSLFFSDCNILKSKAINSFGTPEFESNINELICKFFNIVNIDNLDNPETTGPYKNYTIDNMLYFLKYISIFDEYNLEIQNILSLLISFELILNNKDINESKNDIYNIITKICDPICDKYYCDMIYLQVENNFNILKNYNPEQLIEKMKKVLSTNIRLFCTFEANKKMYEEGKVSDEYLISHLDDCFNNVSEEKINYPIMILQKYLNLIIEKSCKNVDSIEMEKIIKKYQNKINQYNIPFDIDVKHIVLNKIEYTSYLFQFLNKFSTEKLTIIDKDSFNDSFAMAAVESEKLLDFNQLLQILKNLSSDIFEYNNEQIFYHNPNRLNLYQDNPFIQNIKFNVIKQMVDLYKKEDERIIEFFNSKDNKIIFDLFHKNNLSMNEDVLKIENDLFMYEAKKILDSDEVDTMNKTKILSIDDIIEKLSGKKIHLIEPRFIIEKLKTTPYLKFLYYKTISPIFINIDINEKFPYYRIHISKYIKYKNEIPEVGILWKNYILKIINDCISIKEDVEYTNSDLYFIVNILEEVFLYDENVIQEIFGEKFNIFVNKLIYIIKNNLSIEREADFFLNYVNDKIGDLEKKYILRASKEINNTTQKARLI